MVTEWLRRTVRLPQSSLGLAALGVGTVLLFLFAVQLLGAATEAARPLVRRLLLRVVVGDASALGLSWLAAYVLGNGSVVAALSLSLFESGLVTDRHLFLMLAGSRLGAGGIVLVVGALDFVGEKRYSLRKAVGLGLLTFTLTLSVYLPATLLGYALLPVLAGPLGAAADSWTVSVRSLSYFEPVVDGLTAFVGAGPAFLLAVGLLFGSLRLFDAVLGRVETDTVRNRLFSHFERTWLSFGLGLLITVATTSVAFSLGVVVPLYNRGYVERDELVPYVLGANVGTLGDTLLVAFVLQTPVGAALVGLLLGIAAALTVAVLLFDDRYVAAVGAFDDRLAADRTAFLAFVAALVAVPLALFVVPLALAAVG